MKKIKFEKKLSLSKQTIAKLNNDQLIAVKGGTVGSCACDTDYVTCLCTTRPGGCPAFTVVNCNTQSCP